MVKMKLFKMNSKSSNRKLIKSEGLVKNGEQQELT